MTSVQLYDRNGEQRFDGTQVGGGGAQPAISLATTTLTAAQLLDIGNTPVVVVPAPGASKAVFVWHVFAAYKFVTTPYSGDALLEINPTYDGYTIFKAGASAVLTKSFDAQLLWDSSGGVTAGVLEFDHTDLAEGPWLVSTSSSTLADGDGTLTVYCLYSTFDLPT